MKKIVGILCLILISSLSFAKSKIYVGTNAEFPPFEYLENGKIVGFDIELLEEMGKIMGEEIKIVDMTFDGLLPALQMKKIDVIIAGMTATEERRKRVDFTEPYYTANQVIITLDGDTSISKFDDLKGKKVGVMLGFTGDIVVSEMGNVDVTRFSSAYSAILALKSKKIDAVVLDSEPAKNYVEKNTELRLVTTDSVAEEYAIALRKNDKKLKEKLENALKIVKENGTYDKLLKKYFN